MSPSAGAGAVSPLPNSRCESRFEERDYIHQCWRRDGHQGRHWYRKWVWTEDQADKSISISLNSLAPVDDKEFHPVMPWHFTPRCATCGSRSTQTDYDRGYFCDSHMLREWAEEALDSKGWYSSQGVTRYSWRAMIPSWLYQFEMWVLR